MSYTRHEVLLDLLSTVAELNRREREAALARAALRYLDACWHWQPGEEHEMTEERRARRAAERHRRDLLRRDLEQLARQRGRGGLSSLEAAVAVMKCKGRPRRAICEALDIAHGTLRSIEGRLRLKLAHLRTPPARAA